MVRFEIARGAHCNRRRRLLGNGVFLRSALAAALALTRPATTLAVDFWEDRGCVERRKIVGDRRSFGVYLTAVGEEELRRLRGLVRKADAALTASLTEAENKELRRLLTKIHR